MAATPALPTRFPCWVKAVYSWGGESKRDLGFMEGDLIECLNAGDGMWWMGRLRRDRRMVGLFPSNFVTVLGDDFRPTPLRSQTATPNNMSDSSRSNSVNNSGPATPSPTKSMFRTPFKAYAMAQGPNPQATQRDSQNGVTASPAGSVSKMKTKPFSSMQKPKASTFQPQVKSRPPSPRIPDPIARGSSPLPPQHFDYSRAPSPAAGYISRASSPLPQNYLEHGSSPPPPPPAHRVAYTRHATLEPGFSAHNYHGARTPSPAPSDQPSGMTPSPLREAMNDVMTSLEGMGMARGDSPPHEPLDPWSPEAFDEIYKQAPLRPNTSLGFVGQQYNERDSYVEPAQTHNTQLQSYVHRMETHLAEGEQEIPMERSLWNDKGTASRPPSAFGLRRPGTGQTQSSRGGSSHGPLEQPSTMHNQLRTRKSAYELGKERLQRTFTTRSSVTTASSTAQSTSTNTSSNTQLTSQSLMSGHSAGGFSATSAGSLARRKFGYGSVKARPNTVLGGNVQENMSGVSWHSSHASKSTEADGSVSSDLLASSAASSPKKRGFFGKVLESVKTGAATARTNMASRPPSRQQRTIQTQSISSEALSAKSAAKEMGLGGEGDWVQMRRDVNRANSLSRNERAERIEKCQLADIPVINPIEAFNDSVEGDESASGQVVSEPTDIASCNFALVDKNTRFVSNLPVIVNAASLAQSYLCRPYKSDVQRLRAIFTWVAERITWEDDFEGQVDTRRVVQSRRGCSEEIACLVADMCRAIGVHAEIVHGHLKVPGEGNPSQDLAEAASRPNHWWNAAIIDDEWRIIDCSLANPTNPRRALYSSAGSQVAESFWFLARPVEICYTHVPLSPEQQHIVPPVAADVLMALPIASPSYFKNSLQVWDYDTSLISLDGLEMAQVQLSVPNDVECMATVTTRAFAQDADGDYFESGEHLTKRALAQGEYVACDGAAGAFSSFKRYTIKAFVPANAAAPGGNVARLSNVAVLNVYAGRRGLTHSINSNPHPLALSFPLVHQDGPNPDFEFFTRHPTPHALRHELYVAGPLCKRLAFNNTFVFGVRQHPASIVSANNGDARPVSPRPGSALSIARPGSAMSMASISMSGSAYSNPSASSSEASAGAQDGRQHKPAKLAIQSPGGKILRMTRKQLRKQPDNDCVERVGSYWETIIKIGERGTWRGLVLADRSARWCVFGEWECI